MKKSTLAILALFVVTAVLFILNLTSLKNKRVVSEDNTAERPQSSAFVCPDQTSSNVYVNSEVGISFSYPKGVALQSARFFDLSNLSTGVPNTSGKEAGEMFGLVSGAKISFGGVTENYSAGRGGSISDTFGYRQEGDKFFLRYVWGEYEIVPAEFLPIDNGSSTAIVIKNTELGMILDTKSVAAYLNTPSEEFPGLVFVLSPDYYTNASLTDEDIATFKAIVSSVCFLDNP